MFPDIKGFIIEELQAEQPFIVLLPIINPVDFVLVSASPFALVNNLVN